MAIATILKEGHKFLLRRANKNDIESLASLLEELFSIEKDFKVDRKKQLSGLESLIAADSKNAVLVIENFNQIIGMCSIQIIISTAEGGLVGLIEDMVIKKAWRYKGLGQALLNCIIEYAKKNNLLGIKLLADINNTLALDFYKKMSFERTSLICFRKNF